MGKLIPVWEIVEKVFAERGRKLTPRLTLVLCDKIVKEINEEFGYHWDKYYYVEEMEARLKKRKRDKT